MQEGFFKKWKSPQGPCSPRRSLHIERPSANHFKNFPRRFCVEAGKMQASAVDIVTAGIAASAVIGAAAAIRYHWVTQRDRALDLARLDAQESIRRAVYAYQARFGRWPEAKADILPMVRFPKGQAKRIGEWDCRIKSVNRAETAARYAILVDGQWLDWDAKLAAPPQQVSR